MGFECEELDVLRHRSGFSGFLSNLLHQIRITCAQTRPWCGVQVRQSHVGDPAISNCQYKPSLRWSFTTFSYPKLGDESFDDDLSHESRLVDDTTTFAEALACPKYSGLDCLWSWSACRDLRTKFFLPPFLGGHTESQTSGTHGLMMSHSK